MSLLTRTHPSQPDLQDSLLTHRAANTDGPTHRPILFFEPTSTAKCTRIIDALASLNGSAPSSTPRIDLTTPNLIELEAMVARAAELRLISAEVVPSPPPVSARSDVAGTDTQKYIRSLCEVLAPFFGVFLVTMGERGVLSALPTLTPSRATASTFSSPLHFTHHAPPAISSSGGRLDVVSTTGAGDTFAGAVLAGLCLRLRLSRPSASATLSLSSEALEELVQLGQRAAILTLQSQEAVAEDLGGALQGLRIKGGIQG